MMAAIIDFDTRLFSFLNGLHADWLDPFFYYFSQIYTWIPLYLFVLFVIVKQWKKKSLFIIPLLILTIVCTDQSCNIIKHSVARLRPSHTVELQDTIHLLTDTDGNLYRGGLYSFPSGHAANGIAFAFFVIFFVAKRRKWVLISIICWTILLAYSRIYLGVHYPFDILCGLILGSCWSLFWIWIFYRYLNKIVNKKISVSDNHPFLRRNSD